RDPGAVFFGVGGAFDPDFAAVALDELLCHEQADAGADGHAGGEEGVEDFVQVLLGNPHAVVFDGEEDAGTGCLDVRDAEAETAAVAHGVDGVGEQVGDDLHHLAAAKYDFGFRVDAAVDLDAVGEAAGSVDGERVLGELGKRDADCGGVLAVVAEGLLGDMGDAVELDLGGREIRSSFLVDHGAKEIEQIEDGLERIVNLVRYGGGHASGCGDLFGLDERIFHALAMGDVAQDLGSADDPAGCVADRRDGEGDVEELAGFGAADGIEVLDTLAGSDLGDDHGLVAMQMLGDEGEDGFADDLLGGVAEDALGGFVPAGDDAVEVLADDGVVGAFDDGGELAEALGVEVPVGMNLVQLGELAGELIACAGVFQRDGDLRAEGADEELGAFVEDVGLFVSEDERAEDLAGEIAERHSEIAADGAALVRKAVAGKRAMKAGIAADIAGTDDGAVFERSGKGSARREGGGAAFAGARDHVQGIAAGVWAGLIAEKAAELRTGELQAGVRSPLRDGFGTGVAGEEETSLCDDLEFLFERQCAAGGDAHAVWPGESGAGWREVDMPALLFR